MSKLIRGVNDLQTKYPDIARYWHPALNGKLTPSDVVSGTQTIVYWQCEKGHSWPARVSSVVSNRMKTQKAIGCPVCAGKVVLKGYNDLESQFPKIAKEWDWERNKGLGLTPSTITSSSGRKCNWIGACGHTWTARVNDRTIKNSGCPQCAKNRFNSGLNDLQTLAPELSNQWNEEKNKIPASAVAANTHDNYWWICEFGHEWQSSPNRRYQTYKKTHYANCPICTKFLHTSFPEKAVYYYACKVFNSVKENYCIDKNRELDIYVEDYKIAVEYDGANFHNEKNRKKDSWKNIWCKQKGITLFRIREEGCAVLDNEEQITIDIKKDPNLKDMDKAFICLFNKVGKLLDRKIEIDVNVTRDEDEIISLQKLYLRKNSLYETHPELLKEWDYEKNAELFITPKGILAHSQIKVYWKCIYNHPYWKVSPGSRLNSNTGCPYCSGKRVLKGINDLATVFPQLVKEWDYELNNINHLVPDEVSPYSNKSAHWICSRNPEHKWSAKITNRTNKGAGCPICSGNKLLIGFNDLKTKYPDVARDWDYEKNEKNPEEFAPSSTETVWWKGKCGHSWDMPIASRTGKKQQGCPFCSGQRVLSGFNDFPTKNPSAFKEWDYEKNNLDPYSLTVSSSKKAFWICNRNPNHKWEAKVGSRLRNNCPYCSGNKVLPGDNDLKTLFPQIAEEWNNEKNGTLKPENFTAHSTQKVWWKGSCGHSWYQMIESRTGSQKQGCPYCAKKRPVAGENDLETLYPLVAKQWDKEKNGDLKPSDVSATSRRIVWWINKDGSSYKDKVCSLVKAFCHEIKVNQ